MSASHSAEEVVSAISPKSMQVSAIDGFQASGKTTLARSLATHWNLQVISADDYLNRNQGGFFAHLKLEELSDALQKTTPCIFEGLCALQILEAVKVSPDLMIYVKRMTIQGWADAMGIDTSMPSLVVLYCRLRTPQNRLTHCKFRFELSGRKWLNTISSISLTREPISSMSDADSNLAVERALPW
jgi:hypothetical protein